MIACQKHQVPAEGTYRSKLRDPLNGKQESSLTALCSSRNLPFLITSREPT